MSARWLSTSWCVAMAMAAGMSGGVASAQTVTAPVSAASTADGIARLDAFLKTVTHGQTRFVQVVASPVRAGESKPRTKTSKGTFAFARPDRFKFEYTSPFPQTIVADGTSVWLYDPDLKQASVRPQKDALAQTPAAVIAASTGVDGLKKDFELVLAPDAEGKAWVQLTPKLADGQIKQMRLGFEGDRLAVLDVQDGFGQRSTLTFAPFEAGVLPGDAFVFKPPAGVSVLKQ